MRYFYITEDRERIDPTPNPRRTEERQEYFTFRVPFYILPTLQHNLDDELPDALFAPFWTLREDTERDLSDILCSWRTPEFNLVSLRPLFP